LDAGNENVQVVVPVAGEKTSDVLENEVPFQ